MKTKTISLIILTTLLALTFSNIASASTIFTDDFESYELGQLNGQGGWVVPSYYMYAPRVQSSYVMEGEKGIRVHGHYMYPYGVEKTGTPTNDGMITIYMERFLGGTSAPWSIIELREGDTVAVSVKSWLNFSYYDGDWSGYLNFGPLFHYGTWFAIQIQWRSSDHKIRYNINGGLWTDWKKGMNEWTTGLDTVALKAGDGFVYYDAIQENLIGQEKIPVLIVPGLLGSAQ